MITVDKILSDELLEALENDFEKQSEFESLCEDFVDKCGYSEGEAIRAAINVSLEDNH